MANVPEAIRSAAVRAIYARLDEVRWETLTNGERTKEYNRMVSDVNIGELLVPYMDAGEIRVWIKDGPAKEYRRALEGIGPFAAFTARTLGTPEKVISSALGSDWSIEADSLSEKPMRCIALGPNGQRRYVIWGSSNKISDLIWHAVKERAEHTDSRPLIVFTRPTATALSASEWGLAQRVCEVVGADCRQVVQEVSRKTQPAHSHGADTRS